MIIEFEFKPDKSFSKLYLISLYDFLKGEI